MTLQPPASIWIASLSLVVALASFFVSYRTQQLSVADELAVRISIPHASSPIQISSTEFGLMGTLVTVSVDFTLTNTGNRKLSVTRYEVYALSTSGGKIFYSGIDGGLVDAKGNPLHLPLTLDIGESANGFVRIGMLADSAAVRTLQASNPTTSIARHELDLALAKQGIDLFGNKVTLNQFSGGSYSIVGPGPEGKSPRVVVVFQTGKGAIALHEAAWYP